jgi:hypothetical protein
MGEDRHFRLSVWRPAKFDRKIRYFPENNENDYNSKKFSMDFLHEEIYRWDAGPIDIWNSISQSEISQTLHRCLLETFAPARPPEQRSISKFKEFLTELGKYLTPKYSAWADSMQIVEIDDADVGDDSINIRANAIICLFHHLQWVVTTFENIPGASITIQ